MPPLPGIFPDYSAPIVRNQPEGRELVMARWGMPSPVFALNGKKSDPGVTNVRNAASPHWRRWLGVESRCVVSFTSFAEPDPQPDGSRPPAWFALDGAQRRDRRAAPEGDARDRPLDDRAGGRSSDLATPAAARRAVHRGARGEAGWE